MGSYHFGGTFMNRNRFVSGLLAAFWLLSGCANPANEGKATPTPTPSFTSLIKVTSTSKPAGVVSYYPTTAALRQNGTNYCFDSMSSQLGSGGAGNTGSAAVVAGTTTLNSASIVYSVNAATAGTYPVRFLYAFGGTETNLRDAWVIVNGAKVQVDTDQVLEFAYSGITDGKWTTYISSNEVSLPLVAGDNEVRLVAVNTPGYTRTITYTRTVGSVTAGTTASGYVVGLPNISSLEARGSGLTAGTGSTSLYSVSTSVRAGTGSISVSPSQDYYLPGTSVTLAATPGSGYVFDSWEGNLSSRAATKAITVGSNLVITARFVPAGARQPSGLVGYGAVQDDEGTAYTLTGGLGGTVHEVKSLAELTTALAATTPLIVKVSGLIDNSANPSTSLNVPSNTTLYGDPANPGHLKNIELKISGQNVIVRNLKLSEVVAVARWADATKSSTVAEGTGNDNISINGGKHIWIDHCEFYSQLAPALCKDFSNSSESGVDGVVDQYDYKDYYDGQIDISDAAQWITISHCSFHDHWKSLLWGDSDTDTTDSALRITLHHNYFKDIHSRMPKIRYGKAHIYNNYFQGLADSTSKGIDVSFSPATVLVQGNYFNGFNTPLYSMAAGGTWNQSDNLQESCTSTVTSSNSSWTPTYPWTPEAASSIKGSGAPTWVGVGVLTNLP